jgi:hypothetical protein
MSGTTFLLLNNTQMFEAKQPGFSPIISPCAGERFPAGLPTGDPLNQASHVFPLLVATEALHARQDVTHSVSVCGRGKGGG